MVKWQEMKVTHLIIIDYLIVIMLFLKVVWDGGLIYKKIISSPTGH